MFQRVPSSADRAQLTGRLHAALKCLSKKDLDGDQLESQMFEVSRDSWSFAELADPQSSL